MFFMILTLPIKKGRTRIGATLRNTPVPGSSYKIISTILQLNAYMADQLSDKQCT